MNFPMNKGEIKENTVFLKINIKIKMIDNNNLQYYLIKSWRFYIVIRALNLIIRDEFIQTMPHCVRTWMDSHLVPLQILSTMNGRC